MAPPWGSQFLRADKYIFIELIYSLNYDLRIPKMDLVVKKCDLYFVLNIHCLVTRTQACDAWPMSPLVFIHAYMYVPEYFFVN